MEDAERVVVQMESLESEEEKDYGDSVLQVAMKENEELFRRMKEEGKEMCQALRELFEPELNEAIQRGLQQGMQQGMEQGMRDTVLRSLNAGNSIADISRIMQIPIEEVEMIAKERKAV